MQYISRPKIKKLDPTVQAQLAEVKSVFKAVPDPYLLHAVDPDFLAALWEWTRRLYFSGRLDRRYKDIIAGAVSVANRCVFCIEAHTLFVQHTDRQAEAALTSNSDLRIDDPLARDLIAWGKANRRPDEARRLGAGFDPTLMPEIVFTALSFHYMNRFVFVFFGNSPFELPPVPGLKWLVLKLAGPMLRKLATREIADGTTAESVPPLTPEERGQFGWAGPDDRVLAITRRAAAAAQAAGASALPVGVREAVSAALMAWDGQEMPLGRVSGDKDLIEFCLILALAPERLTDRHKANFARAVARDEDRIKAVIWIAFQSASRMAQLTGGADGIRQSA